ncbi:hypothetical protein [Bradyrhizobium sp. Tv2a-2]|uniref:hypothetical protein n=1 Tax=Bradyrhizobium sp. Tv2a-2 TaxID=113395 RepID=UPI000415F110|nr:hypothetical protein [Bradyrhizobium sp. Tv2a-2]
MEFLLGVCPRVGRGLAVAACCVLVLAACARRNNDQAASSGQVVAHVGDAVITTLELDNEFRRANIPLARQKDPETLRKILSELVLRKYLVRQAVNAKLDREPGVLLDLLRASDQVLASAYLDRAAAAKPAGQADIDSYIADNPQKFAKREMLSIDQIAFPLNAESQSVADASKDARSLEEIDQKLTEAGVSHIRQAASLLSPDLTADLVSRVHARQADDVFFVRAGSNGIYFKVVRVEPRPLTGEAAAELARQALKADTLKAEAGVAAFSANIEAKYEGEYAGIMGKSSAPADAKN